MEFNWLGFLISILGSVTFAIIFIIQLVLSRRVTRREIYQKIEFASIDLFRYEHQNPEQCWRLYDDLYLFPSRDSREYWELVNHATQIFNLFEMTCEFRRKKIIDERIFETWIQWFWEISGKKTVVLLWPDLRSNYSCELQHMIDTAINCKGNRELFMTRLSKHYHSGNIRKILTSKKD